LLAVSDSAIRIDTLRQLSGLRSFNIDGKNSFDPSNPLTAETLAAYSLLVDTVSMPLRFLGLETSDSLRKAEFSRDHHRPYGMGMAQRRRASLGIYILRALCQRAEKR
jgi:hypothetical protein